MKGGSTLNNAHEVFEATPIFDHRPRLLSLLPRLTGGSRPEIAQKHS